MQYFELTCEDPNTHHRYVFRAEASEEGRTRMMQAIIEAAMGDASTSDLLDAELTNDTAGNAKLMYYFPPFAAVSLLDALKNLPKFAE